ncbi:hypothetical protein HYALB_00004351 [Hymenoscyphus albidus]|uniref:Endo-1,4-beta-xylanase n=1 Tax=Hymenoscyphus albidus TaxID=595503 RepID=A0A9N9Q864_9HELO|nr:hypothetical protein HYALB_00004351 [Hymenoscyphus albidus]
MERADYSASPGREIKGTSSVERGGIQVVQGTAIHPTYRALSTYTTSSYRAISYTATFLQQGNAYLIVYGWTTNPLVEYYIVESYGTHKPSDSTKAVMKGNLTSDGGTCEIMTKMRVNKPSIQGTATFPQFWSIITDKRVGGTVTTGNHFEAWRKAGLKLGSHNYMVVAVEGQDSNGTATVTVGVAPPT